VNEKRMTGRHESHLVDGGKGKKYFELLVLRQIENIAL
jgi:hypothetical protein